MARGYILEVDWDADGDYLDANEDVSADLLDVEFFRGRKFASQLTGRSEPGRLKALLRNPTGLYSPSDASGALFGNLLPARKVSFRVTGDDAKTRWTGFIEKFIPRLSSQDGLVLELIAAGPMSLIDAKVNPPGSSGALTGTHITSVLDEAAWPAGDRTIDTGQTTTGRWFPEDTLAPNAIRDIEETELGFFLEGPDGKLIYEDRHHRLKSPHLTSQLTVSDAVGATYPYLLSVKESDRLQEIFNEVRVAVPTFSVGALAVLWTLTGETPTLAAGESRTWWAQYPNASSGGDADAYVDAWTTPVVGTDVTQTGVDNGDIGIAVSKFARTMKITITNNHGSLAASLTLLQARGTPVTRGNPTTVSAEDATSQADYGVRTFRQPGKYHANTNDGQAFCDYIVSKWKDPQPLVTLPFDASINDTVFAGINALEISDRITVVAQGIRTQLGINKDFYIESIRDRINFRRGVSHYIEFACAPAASDEFWVLGTSALGSSAKLAY